MTEPRTLKVWTNTKCTGHYPVGFAAVVVAESVDLAAHLLNDKLSAHGLPRSAKAEDMEFMPTTHAQAVVLVDGDY